MDSFPFSPAALTGHWPLPFIILAATLFWIACASLVAWNRFRRDKKLACDGARRIPERDLLYIAMIGGWPGAKLAQRQFRHKTRKEPFRTRLNLCLIPVLFLTCGAAALAVSTWGQTFDSRLIGEAVAGLTQDQAGRGQDGATRPMPRRFGPGSDS